jgi:hypothetical protein
VALTFCSVFLSRLILVAMILSSVSLVFTCSHLALISLSLWVFPWITLSHLTVRIRYVDSVMRIGRILDSDHGSDVCR